RFGVAAERAYFNGYCPIALLGFAQLVEELGDGILSYFAQNRYLGMVDLDRDRGWVVACHWPFPLKETAAPDEAAVPFQLGGKRYSRSRSRWLPPPPCCPPPPLCWP